VTTRQKGPNVFVVDKQLRPQKQRSADAKPSTAFASTRAGLGGLAEDAALIGSNCLVVNK
jgi:hypothetical protein